MTGDNHPLNVPDAPHILDDMWYFCKRCGMSQIAMREEGLGCFNTEANVSSLIPKLAEIRFRAVYRSFLPPYDG